MVRIGGRPRYKVCALYKHRVKNLFCPRVNSLVACLQVECRGASGLADNSHKRIKAPRIYKVSPKGHLVMPDMTDTYLYQN